MLLLIKYVPCKLKMLSFTFTDSLKFKIFQFYEPKAANYSLVIYRDHAHNNVHAPINKPALTSGKVA